MCRVGISNVGGPGIGHRAPRSTGGSWITVSGRCEGRGELDCTRRKGDLYINIAASIGYLMFSAAGVGISLAINHETDHEDSRQCMIRMDCIGLRPRCNHR